MTNEPKTTKRFQFGLRSLILTVTVVPILVGVVAGTFGTAAQGVAFRILSPVLPVVVLGVAVIVPCLLMAWLIRLFSGK